MGSQGVEESAVGSHGSAVREGPDRRPKEQGQVRGSYEEGRRAAEEALSEVFASWW